MKKLFTIVLTVSIICVTFSTSHSASYWANFYGGTEYDSPRSILQTSDGGYILVGGTCSFGVYVQAGLVLKLDEVGDVAWRRVFDISTTVHDTFHSVLQTSDGGYIVAGYTYLEYSPFILKLNASGNIVWKKLYKRIYGDDERPISIQHTTDGGYIVLGSIYYDGGDWDIWVMKLDASGNVSWRRTYKSSKELRVGSIQQTKDGGYVIVGYVDPGTGNDFSAFISKLDSNGFSTWGREFGHNDDKFQTARTVIQTPDEGYLVAGYAEGFGVWATKLGSPGNITHWRKGYGDGNAPHSIQQTSDGGYILTGAIYIGGGDYDIYVLKISSNGNVLWKRLYGGDEQEGYMDVCIRETTDLGYIIAGDRDYYPEDDPDDIIVFKTDDGGEIPGCNIIRTGTATATDANVPSNYFFLPNPPDSVTPTVITNISITSQQPSVEKTILCSLVHASSCEGYCGEESPGGCWCDEYCHTAGDCCDDKCNECYSDLCDSCEFNGEPLCGDSAPGGGCYCDEYCHTAGDCCDDKCDLCYSDLCVLDADGDGVPDDVDNCPNTPNPDQLDTYPPGGNSNPAGGIYCGDACECEGEFEGDNDVDGMDAITFKIDFGRMDCDAGNPCNGNFNCDSDVDGLDAIMFKVDFGRMDCPSCTFSCY